MDEERIEAKRVIDATFTPRGIAKGDDPAGRDLFWGAWRGAGHEGIEKPSWWGDGTVGHSVLSLLILCSE